MNVTLVVHRVELAHGAILLFDRTDDVYRLAMYRRRKDKDKGGTVTSGDFDDLVRRELLPHGYHTQWFRVSAVHANLAIGLAHLVEAINLDLDPYSIERYIRVTSWGGVLP